MRRLNWTNLIFFIVTPLIAIGGTFWCLNHGGVHWATVVLAVVLYIASGVSITGGYHRLFSHKSYEASWPVRLFFILFGAAAFQGSMRWWVMDHRHHHRFVDSEKDPYSITGGFWYAHIGWLFVRNNAKDIYDNTKDIDQDPLVRFQNRFYGPLAVTISFLLPAAVAALWGDVWGGLFVAGFARLVVLHHGTFCINSVCHYLGKQPYSDRHSARDSWITALLTFGEGYHNFHHEFPSDYRNAVRAYQFDPTKWIVQLLFRLGWATDLRRTPQPIILQAKLRMEEKRFARRLASSCVPQTLASQWLATARESLQQAYARWIELKQEYRRLKRERVDDMAQRLEDLKFEVRHARLEFKIALTNWRNLIDGPLPAG